MKQTVAVGVIKEIARKGVKKWLDHIHIICIYNNNDNNNVFIRLVNQYKEF
jgi:hypothetical protein